MADRKRVLVVAAVVLMAAAVVLGAVLYDRMPVRFRRTVSASDLGSYSADKPLTLLFEPKETVLLDQRKERLDPSRIAIKIHGQRPKAIGDMFRRSIGGSRVVGLYEGDSGTTTCGSDCPPCDFANPKATCCCCEVYVDEHTGRKVRQCGDFLAPNCRGTSMDDCVRGVCGS
jgi:hypothetical protein